MKTELMKEKYDGPNGDERKRRREEGGKNERKQISEEGEKNERKKRCRKEGKGMVELKNEKSQRKDHHHHSSNNRSSSNGKYDRKTRERSKDLEKHGSKHNSEEEKKQTNISSGLKENKSDEWSPCVDMKLKLDRQNPRVEKHDMECGYKGVKSQGSDFTEADNMKKSTELEEKSPTPTLSDVENSTKYDSRVYKKLKIASDLKCKNLKQICYYWQCDGVFQLWAHRFKRKHKHIAVAWGQFFQAIRQGQPAANASSVAITDPGA